MKEISYPCKIDNSLQPAIYHKAKCAKRPLLVALHTWSYSHVTGFEEYLKYCETNDWNLIFPEFRGPNWTPQGCGSEYVVSDLEDAVTFAKNDADADESRIYLCGGSGGGHCTLYMAGRRPDLWTAVSAWCPITDIAAWHAQSLALDKSYALHIELACGGNPAENKAAAEEAKKRSPLTWLKNSQGTPLIIDINAGIHDGHRNCSVPVSHAINAFNIIAKETDRISADDIETIVKDEIIPDHLKTDIIDPCYGSHTLLLRRVSGNVRLNIFEGGHDLLPFPAMEWLSRQRRAQAPDWTAGNASNIMEGNTQLTK